MTQEHIDELEARKLAEAFRDAKVLERLEALEAKIGLAKETPTEKLDPQDETKAPSANEPEGN